MENVTDTKDTTSISPINKDTKYSKGLHSKRTEYLYLKSEKLSFALYKITEFIDDSEPLKYKIRDLSLSLVLVVASLQEHNKTSDVVVLKKALSVIKGIKSFLVVARGQSFLGDMNFSVLMKEFLDLEGTLEGVTNEPVLDLAVPLSLPVTSVQSRGRKEQVVLSGDEGFRHTVASPKLNHDRRRQIVDFLGTVGPSGSQSSYSIKEIATVIPGCSEKTIQRELSALVASGSVKRVGERRWSRYSLQEA